MENKTPFMTEIPEQEPQRQQYFMAHAKEQLHILEENLGRPLTCCINTFGCQMNARDSEKLLGILETIGYQAVETEDADFVLYNTCTVRENANLRVYGRLGQLGARKKKHPHMMIALCGCMMQEKEVVEKIKKTYRFVDLIFGTHNIFKLAELVSICLEERLEELEAQGREDKKPKHKMVVDVWKDTDQIVEDLPVERKYSFKSGVNIMFGCNNFCSYCIVPYVRGRERSRRPGEIIGEIKNLVEDGVVEVMLLGQNVNSYGKGLDEPLNFAELLEEVEKIEGLERIRFMTSHPKDLSDELIEVMAKSKKICRHLHLPLQSGSSRILKAMNRRYTKEQYLALAEKIKTAIPDISLTTDIIVGFPGETEEDFQATLQLLKDVRYDMAYTFIYSKRSGTPAATMDDQIPEEIKRVRLQTLMDVQNEISYELNKPMEGQVFDIIVEGPSPRDEDMWFGRTSGNKMVLFPKDDSLSIGQTVPAHIDKAQTWVCYGSIVK